MVIGSGIKEWDRIDGKPQSPEGSRVKVIFAYVVRPCGDQIQNVNFKCDVNVHRKPENNNCSV